MEENKGLAIFEWLKRTFIILIVVGGFFFLKDKVFSSSSENLEKGVFYEKDVKTNWKYTYDDGSTVVLYYKNNDSKDKDIADYKEGAVVLHKSTSYGREGQWDVLACLMDMSFAEPDGNRGEALKLINVYREEYLQIQKKAIVKSDHVPTYAIVPAKNCLSSISLK